MKKVTIVLNHSVSVLMKTDASKSFPPILDISMVGMQYNSRHVNQSLFTRWAARQSPFSLNVKKKKKNMIPTLNIFNKVVRVTGNALAHKVACGF